MKKEKLKTKAVGTGLVPDQKGITLIALIITIIVMLILVGVTINVAINGGLFDTAKEAKRKTEQAVLNEELTSIIATLNADIAANQEQYIITEEETETEEETLKACQKVGTAIYSALTSNNLTVTNETIIDENDTEINIVNNNGTEEDETDDYLDWYYIITSEDAYSKGMFTIDEETATYKMKVPCTYKENEVEIIIEIKGTDPGIEVVSYSLEMGVEISITQTTEEVAVEAGGNVKEVTDEGVPIPTGFYYVTGTKDTGVVISDSQEDENNESGNNGNQFVWVPVGTNPKLTIKVSSLVSDITTVRILDYYGYDETFNVNSDNFEKTLDITKNTIYEVIVTCTDGTQTTEMAYPDGCYETTTISSDLLEWFSLAGGESATYSVFKDTILEEDSTADVSTNIAILKNENLNWPGYTYVDNRVEQDSVQKYGGFYIARYEVGTDGTIRKGQTVTNNIAYADAKTAAEAMYTDSFYGVSSALPSGAAWDSICRWLVKTGSSTTDVYVYCGSGKGNYSPISGSGSYKKSSGYSEGYKFNNIYDLAGNLKEWTTETTSDGTKNITRGRSYEDRSYKYADACPYRRDESSSSAATIGYRPILYIN